MSNKPNLQEEEIDLGNLFQQIGNMFRGFFNFIGGIFSSLFHNFIVLLLFLKKHILILSGATVIGVIIGIVTGLDKKPVYESNMLIEVGYNSGAHLFKQIDYLNELLKKGDASGFATIFNLKEEEVAGIYGFKVESIDNEKFNHIFYDEFQQARDTTYVRTVEFENFVNRITDTDYRFYTIEATGTNQTIFPQLNDSIVSLLENDYFKAKREHKVKNLNFEQALLEKEIKQIDSLRKRYQEVAFLTAKQKAEKNSGVSFKTLNNNSYKGNADIDLFSQTDSLRLILREVNEELLQSDFIAQVKSDFVIGTPKKSILNKPWALFGLLGFLLAFLALASIQFNKYLINYEKNTAKE